MDDPGLGHMETMTTMCRFCGGRAQAILINSNDLVPGYMVYSPGAVPETNLSPLSFILESWKRQINKTKIHILPIIYPSRNNHFGLFHSEWMENCSFWIHSETSHHLEDWTLYWMWETRGNGPYHRCTSTDGGSQHPNVFLYPHMVAEFSWPPHPISASPPDQLPCLPLFSDHGASLCLLLRSQKASSPCLILSGLQTSYDQTVDQGIFFSPKQRPFAKKNFWYQMGR